MEETTKRTLFNVVEILARLFAVVGLGYFAFVAAYQAMHARDTMSILMVVDQAVNVAFVVVARWPIAVDRRPHVVLIAVATTFANMVMFLVTDARDAVALVAPGVVYALQLAGIGYQLVAKLSLGRSFGIVPANRGVRVGGAYRLTRHPMYTGYAVSQLGVLLGRFSWRGAAVIAVFYGLLATRAWLEERVLAKDERYREYQARVKWRVIPFVF